ncbi:SPOR domain-containing protein [Succinimonas amylolytica]|uniref:SPOR domain-containing protein n=3 Tax=Succinimonas amylolytica TaxID=83769 RepID=UPI00037C8A9A|nr:SPOR domain-containing protein [Succinimonas amylolytica]
MSNKIAKVVIGFLVITGATAYILPILYPDDGQDPLPLDVRAAYIRSQSAAATHTAAAAKGEQGKDDDDGNLSDTEFAGNEPLGYMDGEEDGYGGLLDENGAPAPADSSGNRVVSGVVVGGDAESSRSGFVNNPTATGSTPAEAARAHKENRERDLALRVERDRQAREQSLLEAQKKAEQDRLKQEAQKKAEQDRLKQEAQKKAEQDRLKQEAQKKAEQDRLKQEAQKKAEQDRLKQEAQKKAEQDRLKQEAQKKAEQEKRAAPAKGGDAIPGGRYLQIGVFSTMAQAEAARQRLKNQKIRISKDSSIKPGFGYKIDTVSRPGQYVLLVGPTTGDKVLNEIKPLVGSGSFVVSR